MKMNPIEFNIFRKIFLVLTLTLAACSEKPLAKVEGEWTLDVNAMVSELVKLKLDITPETLDAIRLKLEKEKPRMRIDGKKIEMQIESASTIIEYRLIAQQNNCIDLLIASKTEMRYCLEDGGNALRTSKIVSSPTAVTEIYRRSR